MCGTCFFIGHRDSPYALQKKLDEVVKEASREYGITRFVVGCRGNFDRWALSSIMKVKKKAPNIEVFILLAYHPADHVPTYPNGVDGGYYPKGLEYVPKKFAILKANQIMVQECDLLIAHAQYPGNARNLVQYAMNRGVRVRNLAEDTE